IEALAEIPGEEAGLGIEQRPHPRVGLLGQFDDRRPFYLAVEGERHGDAHGTVDGVFGQEGRSRDGAALGVTTDVEAIEVLLGSPAGLFLDGLPLGGGKPDAPVGERLDKERSLLIAPPRVRYGILRPMAETPLRVGARSSPVCCRQLAFVWLALILAILTFE